MSYNIMRFTVDNTGVFVDLYNDDKHVNIEMRLCCHNMNASTLVYIRDLLNNYIKFNTDVTVQTIATLFEYIKLTQR